MSGAARPRRYLFGSCEAHIAALYGFSLALLTAYALLNVFLADNGVDSGKYVRRP